MSDDAARQNFLNRIRIRKDLEQIVGTPLIERPDVPRIIETVAALETEQQNFVYQWTRVVAGVNEELAAVFLARAGRGFELMDQAGVDRWVVDSMDAFDRRGLGFAMEAMENVTAFAESRAARVVACEFDRVSGFLNHYVRGLGGRELSLVTDRNVYTDTEKLFLPEQVSAFAARSDNADLFKLTAVHLWAQTWFGTWRYRTVETLLHSGTGPDGVQVFNRLECIRLRACISRELRGLESDFRRVDALSEVDPLWQEWEARAAALLQPTAASEDSVALVPEFLGAPLPELKDYQFELFPNAVRDVLYARIEREKAALKNALGELQQGRGESAAEGDNQAPQDPKQMGEFSLAEAADGGDGEELKWELRLDGEAIPLSDEIEHLLGSMMQDFGEIPEEHLEGVTPSPYPENLESAAGDHLLGPEPTEAGKVFTYREWDYTRRRYREAFCLLSELEVAPGEPGFVQQTLEKYSTALRAIRKTFEAVLGESRLLRRQHQGDEIDLDALVEAHADTVNGVEMSEHLYMRYRNVERNIAVMFMVDMSGSTLGWVNDAERESLILLCEALETLGDRYAIYGFSGRTNKRCEVYRVKEFSQPYNEAVKCRISGIRPKSYTRMGAAIRHLGHLLEGTQARTKVLITLSDGRPEDYGGYKGRYGIEDTRHALLELKRAGIHSFCITIDKEAQDYLPHMYGVANYAVVDDVKKLPYKVADIYRKLTT